MVQLGHDQCELDVGPFFVGGRSAQQHFLKALRRGFDADPREVLAQPPGLPAAKNLTPHRWLMRELPSFVPQWLDGVVTAGILSPAGHKRQCRGTSWPKRAPGYVRTATVDNWSASRSGESTIENVRAPSITSKRARGMVAASR